MFVLEQLKGKKFVKIPAKVGNIKFSEFETYVEFLVAGRSKTKCYDPTHVSFIMEGTRVRMEISINAARKGDTVKVTINRRQTAPPKERRWFS